MRLTDLADVRVGEVLAGDVGGDNPAVPLVRAGVALYPAALRRLQELGVGAVWIRDPLTEDLPRPDPVQPRTRARATGVVLEVLAGAQEAVARGGPLGEREVEAAITVVQDVLADLDAMPSAALALGNLAAADAYTHHHSVNVCVVGLVVAREHLRRHGWTDRHGVRRHDGIEGRLRMLGLGLLLHDIGKALVPPAVLNKPGRLTPEEWAVVQRHPELGADLLPATIVPPPAIAVVRDHHERCDGSGYGRGKGGEDLHDFALIAAVADTFDAVVAQRAYQRARPASDAVWIVQQGAGTLFDPDVVDSFSRVVAPYPLGTQLDLEDGRRGVVVRVDMDDPWHPVVRVREHDGSVTEVALESAVAA